MDEHERKYIRFRLSRRIARRYLFRGEWTTIDMVAELTGWSRSSVMVRRIGNMIEDRPLISRAECRRMSAKRFLFRGERLTAREVMEQTGRSSAWVYKHVSGDTILEQNNIPRDPPITSTPISFRGESLPPYVWARRLGISSSTIYSRLYSGWPATRALSEPPQRCGKNSIPQRNRRIVQQIASNVRRARNAETIRRMIEGCKLGTHHRGKHAI